MWGGNLFRQIKGVSMGCYFSKEISDLVLLFSEYNYLRENQNSNLILLNRYANDGFLFFNTDDISSIKQELSKLMTYYPSN